MRAAAKLEGPEADRHYGEGVSERDHALQAARQQLPEGGRADAGIGTESVLAHFALLGDEQVDLTAPPKLALVG